VAINVSNTYGFSLHSIAPATLKGVFRHYCPPDQQPLCAPFRYYLYYCGMKKFIYLLLLVFCFAGCKKNNQAQIDQQTIEQYISANHLNATAEPNGLYYVVTTAGSGSSPAISNTVTVNYTGYYTNGTIFNPNTTSTFALADVIAGWQEGIPLMKGGGKGILLVPSALAYGSAGSGSVPPNTVLIFNVELISFH
jgi:FKBP-type peptidyl-prolyl cis-trans isomerase FkpA